MSLFKNKTILITGGTGSFGNKFVETLLKANEVKKIIIYSRDEFKQHNMRIKFNNKKLRFFIGDVRDYSRLKYALENVDIVVHAAAIKHVPVAEYNPFEAIQTNVYGAQNLIAASIDNKINKVIALSTDKACSPLNLYGATKLAADKLFIAANNFVGKKNISFSIVRYGNVIGSRGSVLDIFKDQSINNLKNFTITSKDMTRFFITLEQGVKFVQQCFELMKGGEIFIPKIPSMKIEDLAHAINNKMGLKETGIRPGEKLDEVMFSKDDSSFVFEFKKYYVLSPSIEINNLKYYNKSKSGEIGKKVKNNFEYSSKTEKFMTIREIQKFLKDNKLL